MAWHSALAISVLGLSVLGFGKLEPPEAGGPVAVLVAPWETGGMVFAANVDLPIINIAWGGHLVTFDASSKPQALEGLGLITFAASGLAGCSSES